MVLGLMEAFFSLSIFYLVVIIIIIVAVVAVVIGIVIIIVIIIVVFISVQLVVPVNYLVAPSTLTSLVLTLQLFQFQSMMLFKSSMLLFTSSFFIPSFNPFDVTRRAPITTGVTTICDKFQIFSLSVLVHYYCLPFSVLSTQSFCPQAQQYQ